jgi:excisionase family DNA binding protein
MTTNNLINPKQVTEKLSISYATLLRRVKSKEIPFVKVGNKLLFPVSYFDQLEKQAYSNLKRGGNDDK